MPTKIQIKRGTRAQLDTAKSAAGLRAGELYHITDESRIAIGSGASSYIALVKESEADSFTGVAAPTNLLPKPGAIGLTNVRLVGSIYYSTEGKAHAATKVQISSSATFGTLAFEATKGAVTGVSIKAADIASNASYYWRMAYQDADGAWSDWSVPTAFAVGALVDLPEGGTITTDGAYTIHTFTSSGTFVLPAGRTVDLLVVAGGGGGGCRGGGGGGGGVVYKTAQVVAAGSYAATVGAGGGAAAAYGAATNGASSKLGGIADAVGGGAGGSYSGGSAAIGGSGGGGAFSSAGAGGTVGQGFKGGYGGGGGGGGGDGFAAPLPNGGAGFACAISPHATHYAGGGGGSEGSPPGGGGVGGGGASWNPAASNGVDGGKNTGGGGGAGKWSTGIGGAGGSGIVIVRYLS